MKKNNKTSIFTNKLPFKITQKEINSLDNSLKKQEKQRKLRKKRTIPNVLNEEDLDSLIVLPKLIHKTKQDKMNEVILLMAYLGLRVSEAINFDWSKQEMHNRRLCFNIIGKGGDERAVFNIFANNYIADKSTLFLKDPTIFTKKKITVTRTGVYEQLKIRVQKLYTEGLWNKWSKKDPQQIWIPTPHDFRRSFATRLICEKKLSMHQIRRLLGHSFLITTEKYLKDDPRLLADSIYS